MAQLAIFKQMSGQVSRGGLVIIKQMSRHVSHCSSGNYQSDERAGIARLTWRLSGR